MKNHFFLLILLLAARSVVAQTGWMEKDMHSTYPQAVLKLSDDRGWEQSVRLYLLQHLTDLQQENAGLKLNFYKESPLGRHYDFVQTYKGTEIFGSEIKINIALSGKILSVFDKTISFSELEEVNPAIFNPGKFSRAIGGSNIKIEDRKAVIFPAGQTFVWAWQVTYSGDKPVSSYTAVIDGNYNVLYRKDNAMYSGAVKDSLVKAYVFLPDPITTADTTYGGRYRDFSDSAVPALDSQRKPVFMTVKYATDKNGKDSFFLQSPYVYFIDAAAPRTAPTFSTQPVFDFSRHQSGFEDVNVFYHMNVHQKHLHDLGVKNLMDSMLRVDAHYDYGDQSQFIAGKYFKNHILILGVGGVDDGEDADVVIHEYTHGIRHSASPNTFNGAERCAAEEGFCDYFACSYSKFLSMNQWEKCYNWDGHNEFWDGRSCASKKVYPKDMTGDIHVDGEIFSGALMAIHDEIGRDTTDYLMLLAFYSLTNNMKMPEIARLFLQADSSVLNGRHAVPIIKNFVARGLLPDKLYKGIEDEIKAPDIKVLSRYFTKDGILYVRFEIPQTGRVSMYSLDGKEIFNSDLRDQADVTFYHPELPPGMYVLHISTKGVQQAVKLMKQ